MGERERLTNVVRDELSHFARSNTGELKPMNVQSRLTENALYLRYLRFDDISDSCSSRDNSSENSVSDDIKFETISDDERLEIVVPDEGRHYEQKVYAGPRQKAAKVSPKLVAPNRTGQSLLKPIHQRKIEENDIESFHIQVVRPEIGIKKVQKNEEKEPTQPAAISLSRMRLAAALSKAKDATKSNTNQNRIQTELPEPVVRPVVEIKCNTPLSSSQSSNASSSVEMERDEESPVEMGQENFLRIFGLCTPAYTEYLMNRRPQRKKRTCTSTERMDFHYGKFELFEKQFANKRNKRQFLYSPPATRAKRRVGSNGSNAQAKELLPSKRSKGIKSNSSSSSISSNGSSHLEKVCVTCYKRSRLTLSISCILIQRTLIAS